MGSALYDYAKWGNVEGTRQILQDHPEIDINWRNKNGKTSLFIAASWGFRDVVQLLLENKAKCGENGKEVKQLLRIASYYRPRYSSNQSDVFFNNHTKDVKDKLLKNAKIFIRNVIEQNLYSEFLTTVRQDGEKLSPFEENTQQDIPDDIMNIILYYNHFATTMLLSQAVSLNRSDLEPYLQELIDCRKVGEDESEKKGQELYNTAAYGDIAQVSRILSAADNLNINWTNSKGNSALFIAAAWGNWDIVKLLIENGASTSEKETLLRIASNTQPRDVEVPGDLGTYYSAHTISSKKHALEKAKKYISHILESRQYLDVLTDAEEDYKMLISPDLQCQEGVPDDIMNIVMYYNHFATVAELLNATAATEELQKYNTILLGHRQCYEVARMKLDQQLKTECKQEAIK